jgi:hypothetical protein
MNFSADAGIVLKSFVKLTINLFFCALNVEEKAAG